MKLWLLLVNHGFQALGDQFPVDTTPNDLIYHLKKKVKEENQIILAHVDTDDLTVWKTKGEMTINNANIEERSAEILRTINVDDKDTIEELGASEVVADLELSDGQILLIRMPGMSRISTTVGCVLIRAIATTPNQVNIIRNPIRSKVDQEYQVFFLHAHTKGRFTEDDFFRNQVADVNEGKVPEFVEKYEKMLGQKRRVTSDVSYFHIPYHVFDS